MSIFRKVPLRLHRDRDFRELSKPQPNGQWLYVYCITAPSTIALPGVLAEGKAAIAEALGWTLEEFEPVFVELASRDMAKADWSARLIFLPRVIHDNKPESPNVVKAWRTAFDELPDCDLKSEIFAHVKAFLKALPEAFRRAFDEDIGEDLAEGSRDPSANQKQEQKHKQQHKEREQPAPASGLASKPKRPWRPHAFFLPGFDAFWESYPKHVGKYAAWNAWNKLRPDEELQGTILKTITMQKASAQWQDLQYVPNAATWLNQQRWLDELPQAKGNGGHQAFTGSDFSKDRELFGTGGNKPSDKSSEAEADDFGENN